MKKMRIIHILYLNITIQIYQSRHALYEFNIPRPTPILISISSDPNINDKDNTARSDDTIGSPTQYIIPDVKYLHDLLISKYEKCGDDIELFRNRASFKDIAKILTMFRQHESVCFI